LKITSFTENLFKDQTMIHLKETIKFRIRHGIQSFVFISLAALLIASAISSPAYAQDTQKTNESDRIEHGYYINKSGKEVHSPAHTKSGKPPDGATAKCRDGAYSFSQSHRGTCSRHGGVAQWL
jgi:hypothetical protein